MRPETVADVASAEALHAQLVVRRFRRLERVHLQWAAVVSLPIWFEALGHVVPGALAWLAVLAQGSCLALADLSRVVAAMVAHPVDS